MEVQVFGSGSSGNCYLLRHGRHSLLLEAGLPFKEIQRALQFRVSSLDGCLVTHEHMDHAKAIKDLMKAGVDVYLSQATADAIGAEGHRCQVVRSLEQVQIGLWSVMPFPVPHDVPCLGFMVGTLATKAVYVTDAMYLPYRFPDVTHFLLEANYSLDILDQNVREGRVDPGLRNRIIRSHMSLETALGVLRANDLSALQEVHLLHLSDQNSDAERFKREAQQVVGKPVYIA